jgi:dTDP-4-dehydrorhamnose 3,5-epimerase
VIEGVQTFPLRPVQDERGFVLHMLRADEPHFEGFGEIYFSVMYPGIVKGWHLHSRMTIQLRSDRWQHQARVVRPTVRFEDARPGAGNRVRTDQLSACSGSAGIVNGFTAVGNERAIVANCASIPHDPSEITRLDPFTLALQLRGVKRSKMAYNFALLPQVTC